jgi:hypothetical protein
VAAERELNRRSYREKDRSDGYGKWLVRIATYGRGKSLPVFQD